MKGRKPSATAAELGTAHKRPMAEIAPVEHPSLVTVSRTTDIPLPRQLPRTKAVKALWAMLLREVAVHGMYEGDLPLLEALCVAKVRHSVAGMDVKKNGMIIDIVIGVDKAGEPIVMKAKNPMLKEERDQAVLYDRFAQRMGLSPEARVRLNLMKVAGAALLGGLAKASVRASRMSSATSSRARRSRSDHLYPRGMRRAITVKHFLATSAPHEGPLGRQALHLEDWQWEN